MISIATEKNAEYELQTGRFGMWIFLAMETLFFGGALFLYWGQRHAYPSSFALASSHLKTGIAAVNTVVLLTSSFTMALCAYYSEKQKRERVTWLLVATAILGIVFLALKGYEYVLDFREGLLPGLRYQPTFHATREVYLFLSLYLFLTGLHAIHLTIGVFWCAITAYLVRNRTQTLHSRGVRVEVLGLYWHFVDIVWVLLLPLLYLIGGAQ